MMLTAILSILLVAVYVHAVLPLPFYRIRRGPPVMECPQPLWRRLVAALAATHPRLELTVPEFRRLNRLCPEPNRPLVSWRGSRGYYDQNEADTADDAMPAALFRSRLSLLLLPLRVPLDHALTPLVNVVTVTAYLLALAVGWTMLRWTAWRHRAQLAAQPPEQAQAFAAHLHEHLEVLVPEAGTGPLPVLAEPGYFMFKLAEGRAFREAVSRFGGHHPNCEIGPDDGSISALHLAAIDRLDHGLNTNPCPLAANAKPYGDMRLGFIEDMPFPAASLAEIYLIHVVDHIPDLDAAMAALAAMLQPGGRLIFSGLSHDFSGWWLEQACAAGCVWNNWPLERYAQLCQTHGLEMEWGRYCQPFPASLVWKATYGFAMKTRAWAILGGWLGAKAGRRRLARRLLRRYWLDVYRLEDHLLAPTGTGLNFIIVARRSDAARS